MSDHLYVHYGKHRWLTRPLTIDETQRSLRAYLAAMDQWYKDRIEGLDFDEPSGPILTAQAHLAVLDAIKDLQGQLDTDAQRKAGE